MCYRGAAWGLRIVCPCVQVSKPYSRFTLLRCPVCPCERLFTCDVSLDGSGLSISRSTATAGGRVCRQCTALQQEFEQQQRFSSAQLCDIMPQQEFDNLMKPSFHHNAIACSQTIQECPPAPRESEEAEEQPATAGRHTKLSRARYIATECEHGHAKDSQARVPWVLAGWKHKACFQALCNLC